MNGDEEVVKYWTTTTRIFCVLFNVDTVLFSLKMQLGHCLYFDLNCKQRKRDVSGCAHLAVFRPIKLVTVDDVIGRVMALDLFTFMHYINLHLNYLLICLLTFPCVVITAEVPQCCPCSTDTCIPAVNNL